MATGDADEAFFHEHAKHFRGADTAYRFDIRTGDRLSVSDHGQRFERGRGQTRIVARMLQSHKPGVIRRASQQLKATSKFFDLKGTAIRFVVIAQGIQKSTRFTSIPQTGSVRQTASWQRFIREKQSRFQPSQIRIAS